jgi:peptide/nickel transport system substrate-binding protein
MMNVIKDELTAFGIPTTYYVCTNVKVNHEHYDTGTGYDLVFQHWGGFCIGTVDWYLETQYLNGIPLNVTQWDGIVTLPNGTQVNVVKLYGETISPNSTSQLIAANDEMAYALNYYLPALPLVFQACQIVVNTKQLNVPPSNSWFWQEYFYGIAGTAIYQLGFTDGLIQPIVTTTSSTVTSTLPVVDIAVGVIVVIIIIAAVAIIMRRRQK